MAGPTGTATATGKMALVERATFTADKPHEVKERLKQLLGNGEVRMRDLERFTSFALTTINQTLSGNYTGDVAKIESGLTRFYRHWIANNAIVETRVVKDIHATMLLAWKRKEIALIEGDFGRGKTKAANKFTALNDYAAFVTISGVSSASELLQRIGDAINVHGLRGSRTDRLEEVIRALQRVPRLIIIDEADRLTPRILTILQDLHGAGTERCGIVLIATSQLRRMLEHPDLGYFKRRITIYREIGDITYGEAKQITDMWIHDLDGDDIKALWAYSLRGYGVATLVNVMMRAFDMHQLSGSKKITGEDLEAAYGLTMPLKDLPKGTKQEEEDEKEER